MTHSILLVDDEPNLLHSLARALRKQPYNIYTARCAEEALQIVKARSVDLVVSDEHMPGKSGTELLTWIAEHLSDVVRIVLTGQPSVPTAMRAVNDAHVFRFFTKPCDVVQLDLAIREGLEKKDSLDQQQPSLSAKVQIPETDFSSKNNASDTSYLHILLVDDSQTILAQVTDFLESNGYAVTAVLSGAEALEQFDPNSIDILIVDYEMPGINGLAVMEAVHEQSPSTPTIFLTSCEDMELAVK